MKRQTLALATALGLLGAPDTSAQTLADMAGSWRGTGWARETPQGPQEPIRCRMTNTYSEPDRSLRVQGRCAVPGRQLQMQGVLTAQRGSEKITGTWSNPDGPGTVPVSGVQRGGAAAFALRAKDPATGREIAQSVEWRLEGARLRVRATDISAAGGGGAQMSDISFSQ